jgi:hypothetical protein
LKIIFAEAQWIQVWRMGNLLWKTTEGVLKHKIIDR